MTYSAFHALRTARPARAPRVVATLAAGALAVTALSGALARPLAAQDAAAQPPAGQPPMGARQGGGMQQMLFEGITLSDAQRTKVDSIQQAFGARMRERREAMRGQAQDGARPDSATRAARFEEMRRARDERFAAIRAVLTPDQQKTFDANVARVREMMQQRMREGGMGPGRAGGGQPSGGAR